MQQIHEDDIFSIASGAFTAKGNFSGYTLLGERVHIPARLMAAKGWSSDEDCDFPFLAFVKKRTIEWEDQKNEQGEVVRKAGKIEDRLQANAIFTTEEEMADVIAQATGAGERVIAKAAKKRRALVADADPQDLVEGPRQQVG
jgi:hypothetical protein